MARLPRLVLPGLPYHVTQRGNRRQRTFFEKADYALHRDLLAAAADKAGAGIWCSCLMPNPRRPPAPRKRGPRAKPGAEIGAFSKLAP